ncbi:unnamed protein product, partial [Mesorhabditis belari]|uniref:CUB domain-containing protein n=1 Tax=Mesorhabditis belari TaxID=2138241 RepID=A0AAF3F553_9BILA
MLKNFVFFNCLVVLAISQCPTQDWLYDTSTNACFLPVLQNLTYADAQKNCQSQNSALISIKTTIYNTVGQTIVIYDAEHEDWWTGGTRDNVNSPFHWPDGNGLTFTNWLPSFPDKVIGHDCLAIHMINAIYGGWQNEDCTQKWPSICVIENALPIPTEDTKDCPQQKYNKPTDIVTSPRWPNNYPDLSDCYYFITVSQGKRVNLTLDFFKTEACCDWLYIYDGPDTQSTKIANLRGSVANGTSFTSSSNTMTLRFTSDESNNDKGFYGRYNCQ